MKKRRTRREISDREVQEWQDLRDYGYSGKEIARMYDRWPQSIYNITLNKPKVYEVYDREERQVAFGTVDEIAEEMNLGRNTALAYKAPSKNGETYTFVEVGVSE